VLLLLPTGGPPGKSGDGAAGAESEGEEAVAEGGGERDGRLEGELVGVGRGGGGEEVEEGGEDGGEVPLQGVEGVGVVAACGAVDEEEEGPVLRGPVARVADEE
jgi:hypothetical protein